MPIDQEKFESLVKNVGPTAVSVAAIFAGFQATIHAILLSMAKSRPMRSLKGSGHLRGLMSYVRWGTFTLVFFVAVSLAVIVMLTLGNLPARPRLFSAVLIGSFVLALVASFRIMNVMLKLLAKASGL